MVGNDGRICLIVQIQKVSSGWKWGIHRYTTAGYMEVLKIAYPQP